LRAAVLWHVVAPCVDPGTPVVEDAVSRETDVNRFTLRTAALLYACLVAGSAAGGELTGALKKIQDSGTLTIGYRDRTIPFSYLDEQKHIVGYSYDIAVKIADAIKRELKLPRLEIRPVPITVQNRFAMVQNGIVDMECTSTTNNAERRKQLAFSNTIFVITTRLMVRKGTRISDFSDLAGKTVVVPALTTSEEILRKLNTEKKLGINIVSTIDRSVSALSMMQAGQADAYMHDDAILYGQIANAWHPEDWAVVGTPQSHEAYGCMMRKDDPEFKKVVDGAIAQLMLSGEAEVLYRKWFQSPIPPNGVNLNFPMSDAMRNLYRHPNDKSYD
jgi:glutamate/aspartate transport system substrate-binding protein